MFITYPSVSALPSISWNQNQSLHDQDTHTSVHKSNGGITRRDMKNVISYMFSPLPSLHLYSFSHFIFSHFFHCLITFIFPLPFSTQPFSFIHFHIHIHFPFPLFSHFVSFSFPYLFIPFFLFFPFPFFFPKFHIIPLFPYISFHFSYFPYFT
jgi:hypothetical protein